jgi:hypothetical protein
MTGNSKWKYWFVAFAGLLLCFAITEIGFRIGRAIQTRTLASKASDHSNWMVYDHDLLYRPRVIPSPGQKGSEFRVVVLGASLIAGKRGSIVSRVESIANGDPGLLPSEWVNTSVPGYTNYQELVYLEKYGIPMRPDLVGVVFSPHDVHKYLANLRVVDGQLSPNSSFWDATLQANDSTKGWWLRLARQSLFLNWLKFKTGLARSAIQFYESGGFDFDYRPDYSTAWQDSQWTMIDSQMTRMRALSQANHFRLFLVFIPFGEQYRKDYLARDEQYVLKPERILSGLMARLQIPYLDLYPDLDLTCFNSDHIHLNEKGKQRAAEKIAEFLKAEKLLPAR